MNNDITKCLEPCNNSLPRGNFGNAIKGFAEGLFDSLGFYNDKLSGKTVAENRGYILGKLAFFPTFIVGGAIYSYLARDSAHF